jgi:hypothetical protein
MEIGEIRKMAARMGIEPAGMAKADLVRAIQRTEGIAECFALASAEDCDEESCIWREDCLLESVIEEIVA